jgi:hypothetical protein
LRETSEEKILLYKICTDHLGAIDRWENSIKLDLREILSEVMDWIYLAHDLDLWQAVVNTVMNINV